MVDDAARRARWVRLSSACSLREACLRAAQDKGGKRCADCPLLALCESEARWLVRQTRDASAGGGYLH